MGELIMRLFHARTNAHILHLKSRSYAAHKALETFYEEIVDIADSIAEAYQGCQLTLIEDYPAKFTPATDPQEMLSTLYAWIDEHRYDDTKETQIQNLIDEALALINSTAYKLKFLK
jgi:DNA-binding ferritin-like protein